jgi:hypothetical protein
MKDDALEIDVADADVSLIRSLVVIWDHSESGAPIVCAGEPWEGQEGAGPANLLAAERAQLRRALYAIPAFVRYGELAPGRYTYETAVPAWALAQEPFVEHDRAAVEGKRITVEVRPEHLKLLKSGNVRIHDGGDLELTVGFDSKRPYGDMTYYYIDMADILGITPAGPAREDEPSLHEFKDAQIAELDAMHETMEPVLQVFLQRAQFRPGRFVQRPAEYGAWQRAD